MGRILNRVICAPITSTIRDLATEVILGPEVGLEHDSAASFDNTFLLHRAGLVKFVGRVTDEVMDQACRALATAVGCDTR
jgi:mRNA interferase MazF